MANLWISRVASSRAKVPVSFQSVSSCLLLTPLPLPPALSVRMLSTLKPSPQKTTLQKYQYKSLPGPRWIRVLQIVRPPGSKFTRDPEHPLSYRLVDVSLDDKPRYDALSYSWDGQVSDRALLLQDQPDDEPRELLVTKNCAEALDALRKHESIDHIWIDAICINQTDLQERNSQVSMMGDVYAGAFAVRVWLGPRTDDSYAALRALLALRGRPEESEDGLADRGEEQIDPGIPRDKS